MHLSGRAIGVGRRPFRFAASPLRRFAAMIAHNPLQCERKGSLMAFMAGWETVPSHLQRLVAYRAAVRRSVVSAGLLRALGKRRRLPKSEYYSRRLTTSITSTMGFLYM